ncbi:TetR/AcrR family transcriptional regulator [Oleispirillum naphthae]|uniref:TetR/AcrR family transcriptional regulator n=1 Tax=Oleispirillum naphthae TaxID=2838853 RepID=UPI0030823DFE
MTETAASCPSMPACRGRKPDPGKREAIVGAACALFLEQGYGVSMETIAAAAGVAKQTIYNLFSTKEQLFGAVVAGHSEIVVAAIDEARDDAEPRAVLAAIARELLGLLSGERIAKVYRMMMSAAIGAGGASEMCEQFYDNGPRRGTRQFAAYLARQHEIGRLNVPDPMLAAESFFGMLNGHILIRNMMGLQSRWSEKDLAAKADYAVSAFLRNHARPA